MFEKKKEEFDYFHLNHRNMFENIARSHTTGETEFGGKKKEEKKTA